MKKFDLEKNINKLVVDLPSSQYHALEHTWSSSQLKDALDDEEYFIKKYVKKEVPRTETEAFDVGNYFHTVVLEPDKVESEICVYPGKTRYGKAWDTYKAKNADKLIITEKQKEAGDRMAEAVRKSHVSMEYLDGRAEISVFIRLTVWNGNIYAKDFSKILTKNGWEKYEGSIGKGFSIVAKARADNLGDHYISDLKSTSGNSKSYGSVRGSISKYKYDLSAAFYLDLFSLICPVEKFIWVFASKDTGSAASWIATDNQILVGRAKWSKAITRIADLSKNKWTVPDYLREAEPLPHELEWLAEKDIDLL